MFCSQCDNKDTKVIDSRLIEDGNVIRRRRQCEYCSHRFNTYERKEYTDLMVVKRDGTKQLYNRAKLKRAIMLASAKRDISKDAIDAMITTLEGMWAADGNEVKSQRVGNDVIEALRGVDVVAYVRFASVYKDFHSLEDFQSILGG